MKIIIVFILIVLILTLFFKLYRGSVKEYFSFTVEPRLATLINDKLNTVVNKTETVDEKPKKRVKSVRKDVSPRNKKYVRRKAEPTVTKEEPTVTKEEPTVTKEETPDEEPSYILNENIKSDEEPTDNDDEVEINVIRNCRKMIRKSLKKINNKPSKITYYKPKYEPNKRLEKTDRPNGYKFINKDNVEPDVRKNSENKSGYTHIKPGKNLFSSYGYSYMPPEVWSVPQDRPPVCIPQKGFEAEALPIYTKGTPLDALEIQQTLMPKFKYEEVYDPKYYYPGWKTK